jgi:hypothetical protein
MAWPLGCGCARSQARLADVVAGGGDADQFGVDEGFAAHPTSAAATGVGHVRHRRRGAAHFAGVFAAVAALVVAAFGGAAGGGGGGGGGPHRGRPCAHHAAGSSKRRQIGPSGPSAMSSVGMWRLAVIAGASWVPVAVTGSAGTGGSGVEVGGFGAGLGGALRLGQRVVFAAQHQHGALA